MHPTLTYGLIRSPTREAFQHDLANDPGESRAKIVGRSERIYVHVQIYKRMTTRRLGTSNNADYIGQVRVRNARVGLFKHVCVLAAITTAHHICDVA